MQREVPPEEVLAQVPRRPNDHPTLELARMTVTSPGWSCCAWQEACDVDIAGVVMLQQCGTGTACGGFGAECELAIETRQREARRQNERGAHIVKGASSRHWQTLPGRWRVGASKIVKRHDKLGEVLGESATVASEAEEGVDLARIAWLRILVDYTRRRRVDANTYGTDEVADMYDLSVPHKSLRQLVYEAVGLDRREHSVQMRNVFLIRLRVDGDVIDVCAVEALGNAVGRVDEAKRYCNAPEKAIMRDECSLAALLGRNGHLPEARVKVEARKKYVARRPRPGS